MKNPNSHIKTFVVLLSILFQHSMLSQNIEITYNFDASEKLIDIFERKELSKNDFNAFIELEGIQGYIKKLSSFFNNINNSSFQKSLRAAVSNTEYPNDPFLFDRIIPNIKSSEKFIKKLKADKNKIQEVTNSLLKPYVPNNITMKIKVNVVIGVVGGGWTFDDEPNTFYVDITSLNGDIEGLTLLCAHEIYHLIQYRFMKKAPAKNQNKIAYIIDQIIREGSAVYIADFSKAQSNGAYINFSKREYRKNFRRMKSNFYLFELLIQYLKNDEDAVVDHVYNIGLSGQFQSPLYYVGYYIINTIEKYLGKKHLLELLKGPPSKVFLEYNSIYLNNKKLDENFIQISDSTLKILRSLDMK